MDGYRRSIMTALFGVAFAVAPTWADTQDSWTVQGQPSGGTVLKLAVDPGTPTTLYAVSANGIFQSTDAGANWSLSLPMPLNNGIDVATDPQNPGTVYASGNGLYKSTDSGATWHKIDADIDLLPGGKHDSIGALTVDPVDSGVVYGISLNTGVYKSTDGGGHWSKINTGLSALVHNLDAGGTRLVVDPAHPQTLFMSEIIRGTGGPVSALAGIYTSTDGGAHWSQALSGVEAEDVAIDPQDDQTLYLATGGGLYNSTDGGADWNPMAGAPFGAQRLFVDPADSSHLWVASTQGLYESTTTGAHWTLVPTGLSHWIFDLAMDPATPANMYVSSVSFGLYKSGDGGATWSESDSGIYGVQIQEMIANAQGDIYIGSIGTGVLKSSDLGATWNVDDVGLNTAGNGSIVYALTEDPQTPDTLYAGTVSGLYKTVDGAATWNQLTNGYPEPYTFAVAIDPQATSTVYTGTVDGFVAKSVDAGASWNTVFTEANGNYISALAVSPVDSNVVFAGAWDDGLFKSTDGGATWNASDTGMPVTGVWAIVIDPANPDTMYVSLTNQDIYKSTDGGATWSNASSGLPIGDVFVSLQLDPSDSSVLYAVALGGGVFITTDGGADWGELNPVTQSVAARSARQAPRTQGIQAHRPQSSASHAASVPILAATFDPNQPDHVFGGGKDGQVYTLVASPSSIITGGNGGSGGTGGSGGSGGGGSSGGGNGGAAAGGGGGGFPLLAGALLLGLALARKRQRGLPA